MLGSFQKLVSTPLDVSIGLRRNEKKERLVNGNLIETFSEYC